MSKIDKKRILSRIDELNDYLEELEKVRPVSFEEYEMSIEKKRSCERILQISIESIIDICNVVVSNLGLGLPGDEDELFDKLVKEKILSKELEIILKNMKGFRNILVHKYAKVDDELVFELLSERLEDFDKFKEEILKNLKL